MSSIIEGGRCAHSGDDGRNPHVLEPSLLPPPLLLLNLLLSFLLRLFGGDRGELGDSRILAFLWENRMGKDRQSAGSLSSSRVARRKGNVLAGAGTKPLPESASGRGRQAG